MLKKTVRGLSRSLAPRPKQGQGGAFVGIIDCDAHGDFCAEQEVTGCESVSWLASCMRDKTPLTAAVTVQTLRSKFARCQRTAHLAMLNAHRLKIITTFRWESFWSFGRMDLQRVRARGEAR
jgi:hypothetical protein